MDHVASGWNGRKSNNILVPDEETNGVSVVGGDLDFFWSRVKGEPTLGLEVLLRIRGDDGQGWIPEVLKKSPKKYNN